MQNFKQAATTITAPLRGHTQLEIKEVQVGAEDEFGLVPDIDSSIPPSDLDAWSLAPSSAAAQSKEDLRTQTKLRKIAEEKAMKIKARCDELERRLTLQATQKRKAEMQRKSKQRDSKHRDPSWKKPRASPQPMTDLIASQYMSEDSAYTSDDGVATPEEPAEARLASSLLCDVLARLQHVSLGP